MSLFHARFFWRVTVLTLGFAQATTGAEAQATRDVVITTHPSGATVVLDGTERGPAPIRVPLATGTHTVVLVLAGHTVTERAIEVPSGTGDVLVVVPLSRDAVVDPVPDQTDPRSQECPAGMYRRSEDEECCWAGQRWAADRETCIGAPICPVDQMRVGSSCQPAPCPPGQVLSRGECVDACPDGQRLDMETGRHCCSAGEAWSVEDGACRAGPGECAAGAARTSDECSSAAGTASVSPTGPPAPIEELARLLHQPAAESQRVWWPDVVPTSNLPEANGLRYRSIRLSELVVALAVVPHCEDDAESYAVQSYEADRVARITVLVSRTCEAGVASMESFAATLPVQGDGRATAHWEGGTVTALRRTGGFAYRLDLVARERSGVAAPPPRPPTMLVSGAAVRREGAEDDSPQPSSSGNRGSGDLVRVNFLSHLPRTVFPRERLSLRVDGEDCPGGECVRDFEPGHVVRLQLMGESRVAGRFQLRESRVALPTQEELLQEESMRELWISTGMRWREEERDLLILLFAPGALFLAGGIAMLAVASEDDLGVRLGGGVLLGLAAVSAIFAFTVRWRETQYGGLEWFLL